MQDNDYRNSLMRLQIILHSKTLTKAILRLPKKERSVFVMTYIKKYPLYKVCNVLKLSRKEVIAMKEKALDDFFWNIEKFE